MADSGEDHQFRALDLCRSIHRDRRRDDIIERTGHHHGRERQLGQRRLHRRDLPHQRPLVGRRRAPEPGPPDRRVLGTARVSRRGWWHWVSPHRSAGERSRPGGEPPEYEGFRSTGDVTDRRPRHHLPGPWVPTTRSTDRSDEHDPRDERWVARRKQDRHPAAETVTDNDGGCRDVGAQGVGQKVSGGHHRQWPARASSVPRPIRDEHAVIGRQPRRHREPVATRCPETMDEHHGLARSFVDHEELRHTRECRPIHPIGRVRTGAEWGAVTTTSSLDHRPWADRDIAVRTGIEPTGPIRINRTTTLLSTSLQASLRKGLPGSGAIRRRGTLRLRARRGSGGHNGTSPY